MKRSRIDRLFRLWDLLCYFRYKDTLTHHHLSIHLRTRNKLKRAILKEYNLDAHGLRTTMAARGCILLTKPVRKNK